MYQKIYFDNVIIDIVVSCKEVWKFPFQTCFSILTVRHLQCDLNSPGKCSLRRPNYAVLLQNFLLCGGGCRWIWFLFLRRSIFVVYECVHMCVSQYSHWVSFRVFFLYQECFRVLFPQTSSVVTSLTIWKYRVYSLDQNSFLGQKQFYMFFVFVWPNCRF